MIVLTEIVVPIVPAVYLIPDGEIDTSGRRGNRKMKGPVLHTLGIGTGHRAIGVEILRLKLSWNALRRLPLIKRI